MTLPKDPYETTTEQLQARDVQEYDRLTTIRDQLDAELIQIARRLDAYSVVLEGYRSHRPQPENMRQGEIEDPYAGDNELKAKLENLPTVLHRLVALGIHNDNVLKVNEAAHLLHRTGGIGGKWKHVSSRIYKIIDDNNDLFFRIDGGVYGIKEGADAILPRARLFVVGGPTIT